jgi:hypothetical protein
MKKIYALIVMTAFVALPFLSMSQNMVQNPGLEQWENPTTPVNWDKYYNITQENTMVHGGTYSAAHTSDASSQKLRQDIENVTPGTEYTISYWYFDNDPAAKTRIWSYWMDASGTYLDDDADVLRPNTYSTDNGEWQHWSNTLTAPVNAASFRFEVRVYKENNNTGGKVYYDDFSFSGQTTIKPEPSNYPTGFTATAGGLTITLAWTDATGTQLPDGYLILGAKDGFSTTAPQDGTPVADDMDWSDGTAAVNVGFGEEAYTFAGLESSIEYTFTIYPYTNGSDNIDYKTDGTAPEASATTDNLTVLNDENFESGTLGTWTPHNVSGDQEWESYTYNDNTFAKMTGYDDGSHANEDWLVSPELDFIFFISADFTFKNAYKYDGNPLMLMASTDYDGTGNPSAFSWDDLSDQVTWSEGNYDWVESGEVDLSSYLGNKIYLAFKYTSTDDKSSTWEVDDLLVYGVMSVGVGENSAENIAIYPNPAKGYFTLAATQNGQVNLFDVSGRVVMNANVVAGNNTLDIENLTTGIYFVNVVLEDGSKTSVKLMVK